MLVYLDFFFFLFFSLWGGDNSSRVANFLLFKAIISLQVKGFLQNGFLREDA